MENTLNYKFPIIKCINDVLPAMQGRDEFIVADREHFDVVNYFINMEDTFDIDYNDVMYNNGDMIPKGIMRRELRGIIFNKDGTLLSRPFHKFFNVGERAETQISAINFDIPHTILTKEDGSMIRPMLVDGKIRWCTKMGITDVGAAAEAFASTDSKYNKFATFCFNMNVTPLFEYVGPDNCIVVKYTKESLILLALRCNTTGEYIPITNFAGRYNIPTVGAIHAFETLEKLVEFVRPKQEGEGFVVTFVDGHRVKIKNEWYVRIHKVKDMIRTDRHVLALILNNEIDDVIPMLDYSNVVRILQLESDFWNKYNKKKQHLITMFADAKTAWGNDRKNIAVNFVPMHNKTDARFIFGQLDSKNVDDMLLQYVRNNVGNTTKYEGMIEWLNL